jgi:ATP-dependent DNA helicase RecQ
VIFHDATLRAVAALRPADLDALGRVPGVGGAKLARYGEALLDAVRTHDPENAHAA